jgi:hypothetical protein
MFKLMMLMPDMMKRTYSVFLHLSTLLQLVSQTIQFLLYVIFRGSGGFFKRSLASILSQCLTG